MRGLKMQLRCDVWRFWSPKILAYFSGQISDIGNEQLDQIERNAQAKNTKKQLSGE